MSEHTAEKDARSVYPPGSWSECPQCAVKTALWGHGTAHPEYCGLCGVWIGGPDTRVIPPERPAPTATG